VIFPEETGKIFRYPEFRGFLQTDGTVHTPVICM
jgi:hypothetical protein